MLATFTLVIVLCTLVGGKTREKQFVIINGKFENDAVNEYVSNASVPISEEVEAYRGAVTEVCIEYGIEDYVDLLLAIMMQESGGKGQDVFQCSESLGLSPDTIHVEQSINQGVSLMASLLEAAGVTGPADLEHIRLAIQAYNFGRGYISYALEHGGGWTQENTYAFARLKSGGRRNIGLRAEILGPWKYGDQHYTQHVLRYYPYMTYSSEGEAALVPLESRMSWLFPNGIPTSDAGMTQYLTTISVPVVDANGKQSTISLTVHRQLATEIKAIFEELNAMGFPVRGTDTAGYAWREMATSESISHHSYGCVIDLNWNSNPMIGVTGGEYLPGTDPYSVTPQVVEIFKKHGFYWGGDWTSSKDYMHFTYTNH